MRVGVFSTKAYDREFFDVVNQHHRHELIFFEPRLTTSTATLAADFPAVCIFVNDILDAPALEILSQGSTRLIALRCAGFNNVDVKAAHDHGMQVVRVPAYSPHAVAEYTVALILSLNRKVHRAYGRVREGNFALDGLLGFDVHGLTVGIVGTGRIGLEVARIMHGFSCDIVAHDLTPHPYAEQLGVRYVDPDVLFGVSDIITLHCPLTPETHHLINASALETMKHGVMLINTSRGALIDTAAVIDGLKSGRIGYLGMDVYEEEGDLFFENLSNTVIQDDIFARLLTFPNVIITGHQAFFTRNAMENIALTTLSNITEIDRTGRCENMITPL
ncbi:MAG: 2-hydroxyacid dehydrogenase [Desulfomonilia bacterium]|nr:2-hydroxyacid dehydrogenase [Desulfomonilia bacterium]